MKTPTKSSYRRDFELAHMLLENKLKTSSQTLGKKLASQGFWLVCESNIKKASLGF